MDVRKSWEKKHRKNSPFLALNLREEPANFTSKSGIDTVSEVYAPSKKRQSLVVGNKGMMFKKITSVCLVLFLLSGIYLYILLQW